MSSTGVKSSEMPTALQLGGERPREPLGERLVAAAPERQHRRPHRERRLQSRDPPALLVDAHPKRQLLRERLRVARHLGHLIRGHDVAREENDPAEIELARERPEVRRDGIAGEPGNRELADVTTNVAKRHVLLIIANLGVVAPERRHNRNVTQSPQHLMRQSSHASGVATTGKAVRRDANEREISARDDRSTSNPNCNRLPLPTTSTASPTTRIPPVYPASERQRQLPLHCRECSPCHRASLAMPRSAPGRCETPRT